MVVANLRIFIKNDILIESSEKTQWCSFKRYDKLRLRVLEWYNLILHVGYKIRTSHGRNVTSKRISVARSL